MPYKPPRFHQEKPFDQVQPVGEAELEGALAADLATAGGLDAVDVTVTVATGAVILAGTVTTAAERLRAEEVVRPRMRGLTLDNRIRIEAGRG